MKSKKRWCALLLALAAACLTLSFASAEELTVLEVTGVRAAADTPIELVTTSSNTQNFGDANYTATDILNYFVFTYPDGQQNTAWYCRVNANAARFFVRRQDAPANNINTKDLQKGMIATAKAGFKILPGEEVKEDVSFLFNGTDWEKVIWSSVLTLPETLSLFSGGTAELTAALDEGSNAPVYWSAEGEAAEIVSADGGVCTLRGLAVGQTVVTARSGDKTASCTVTVTERPVRSISVSGTASAEQYDPKGLDVSGLTGTVTFEDGGSQSFAVTADMVDFDEDTAGAVTGTVTAFGQQTTCTVEVSPSTALVITAAAWDDGWNAFRVTTNTSNPQNTNYGNGSSLLPELLARSQNYVRFSLQNFPTARFNPSGPYLLSKGLYIFINTTSAGGANVTRDGLTAGDTITLEKGLGILAGERLPEEVTYVYNGQNWVELVNPTDFSLSIFPETLTVGTTAQITVEDDPDVTAVYRFSSDDETVAVVDAGGEVTGVGEGRAVITVSCNGITRTLEITVEPGAEPVGIELVDPQATYYVPVSTAEHPSALEATFSCRYVFEGGVSGQGFTLDESAVTGLDLQTPGLQTVSVTDPETGFSASIRVEVYALKEMDFDTLTVSGFDVSDDRNTSGTWNGHLMISMPYTTSGRINIANNVSSALYNQAQEIADYIVYTRADGTVIRNTASSRPIGIWMLSDKILLMISGRGYPNFYNDGDTLTFLAGMPMLEWKGEISGSNPVEGRGQLLPVAYLEADVTYYFRDDGAISLAYPLIEADGFLAPESASVGAGRGVPLGLTRTPEGATSGSFSFVSSDPDTAFVNAAGVLVGLKAGTATITVTFRNGGQVQTKEIAVTVTDEAVSLSGRVTLAAGTLPSPGEITLTLTYASGAEKTVTLAETGFDEGKLVLDRAGTRTYAVNYAENGRQLRGSLTVTVLATEEGCGGQLSPACLAGLPLLALSGLLLLRRRKN